jgi:hypothetical protein
MKDQLSLRCIRWANLEAMWAREPFTVANNTRQVRKLVEKGKELGYAMGALLVPAGPFPVRDDQLMAVATSMLMRSLDARINEAHVQYTTVRPMRSAVHNQWQALIEGQTASVMMRGTTKLTTSTCPTNGEWFERFMLGYHK